MGKNLLVRGTLISKWGGWAILDESGETHIVRTVEERNISPHVGKKRWWVLYGQGNGRRAHLDRRTNAERAADGNKARVDRERRSVPTISGGAPGSNRRR